MYYLTSVNVFLFQISFIRRRDFHILTNGHNVYTTDKRVEILHAAKSHDWYLVISKANHNDSGIYECQVIFIYHLITVWSEGFLYKVAPPELKNSLIMYFVIHKSVVLRKILKIVVP